MAQAALAVNPVDLVRTELEQVEGVLYETSRSEVEALHEAAQHILGAGGKRLRPQLTLLAAEAVGGRAAGAVRVAAACELVHTATLVHDDIVDQSDSRRGRRAVQFFFGNSASVLMGDYLVVRAFCILAQEPERRLWSLLAETIARMCEGEVLQLCVRGDLGAGIEVYEKIIECKTALLMATCAQFGAIAGGAGPGAADALWRFGRSLGMAFQIQDDILDFLGAQEVLGKPVGGDVREGKVTLPALYALQDAPPADRAELVELYGRAATLTPEEIARVTHLVSEAGGFAGAREHAREYVRRARSELGILPDSPARDALLRIAERVVDRWS